MLPEATLKWFNGDEIRATVFYEKYAYENELIPPQLWKRLASQAASIEENGWYEKFYWLLENFKFVPGGRIMFALGRKTKVTAMNCFYIPIKEDSIEGIFECAKEMARTYSYGGGVGIDISILRPAGSPVNNSAIYSTGAVSFMDLFSKVTEIIGQKARRGALMITIEDSHPDVLDFIRIKNDPLKQNVRYANISVKITDEFMKRVQNDEDWELKYNGKTFRVLKAREIWNALIKNAWASAEPGVIFWDRAKEYSPTEYDEKMAIKGVNPCSEQCLEDYGACNLGSLNLSYFVKKPFARELDDKFWELAEKDIKEAVEYAEMKSMAYIDLISLSRAIHYAVRFLDNVLDITQYPILNQKEASQYARRIGLGVMGLADMFAKLKIRYDDDRALEVADKLFDFIKNETYLASVELAKEKGSFPGFKREKHVEGKFLKGLKEEVLEAIWICGLRNACLLTIAPTGSISILAGASNGIEPIFSLFYKRRSESLSKGEFEVIHPLISFYLEVTGERKIPSFFVSAYEIEPSKRVKMQGVIQKHIDASISSTVNLPKTATIEDVGDIYFYAWKEGCKGITVYRDGSREGVLITEEEAENCELFFPYPIGSVLIFL